MLHKFIVAFGISAGLMLLLSVGSIARAESACKGLTSSQCSGKSDCIWVGGYTRKDNRKVSGYCRAKGGKNAKTGKAKTKKASSSKKKEVRDKESAKKSSAEKSKKEKTTTKKKSSKKSKSDSGKAKTKEKKKAKKTKNAG